MQNNSNHSIGWKPLSEIIVDHPLITSANSPTPTDNIEYVPLTEPYKNTFQIPLPHLLLKQLPNQKEEFKYVFYTPITCSPEEIPFAGYTLRSQIQKKQCEVLVGISLYNESELYLLRTLNGVCKMIEYYCDYYQNRNWDSIHVFLIADGLSKMHPRVKNVLQVLGLFQPQYIMTTKVEEEKVKDVTCHLFQITTQLMVGQNLEVRTLKYPLQLSLCLKAKNLRKLNSHLYLFRAIAPILNPKIIFILDIGTIPHYKAIYHFCRIFERDLNVGGVCGEMQVLVGKGMTKFKNMLGLSAAQVFEYKLSNLMDKTMESMFGYITVLPGAFSAYRWEALQDVNQDEGPLHAYFKGEKPSPNLPKGNVFTSNMYLAEDRILCLELVGKKNGKWTLKFIKDAKAETDVPQSVSEFILQRRRWLNGTFFCQVYAVMHLNKIWESKHSIFRKLLFTLQFVYFAVNLIFSWFAIGNFYLSFYILSREALLKNQSNTNTASYVFFEVLRLLYLGLIISIFIASLGNRPQGSKFLYTFAFIIFSLIMLFMLVLSLMIVIQSFTSGNSFFANYGTSVTLVLGLGSTFGIYILIGLLYGEVVTILTSLFQYLLVLPSYINVLGIFAFCNAHDISWGTKGDSSTSALVAQQQKLVDRVQESSTMPKLQSVVEVEMAYEEAKKDISKPVFEERSHRDLATKREDYYKEFRTYLLLFWVLSNGILVSIISSERMENVLEAGGGNLYLAIILYCMVVLSLFRFGGSLLYQLVRWFRGY